MNKLVEAYQKRLEISNKVYAAEHNGKTLSEGKQVLIATLLNNVNKRMNEAFVGSLATQRSSMGEWKKFCLALTTVAIPNLIAEDLVLVHPMTSIHGYVAYVKYSAGVNKGGVKQGDLIRDPFRVGALESNYTGSAVVEPVSGEAGEKEVVLAFGPVVAGSFGEGKDVKILDTTTASGEVAVTYAALEAGKENTVKVTFVEGHTYKVAYVYDNVVIPQKTIPTLVASMDGIELHAKARRIGVMYSQMAAYEAKQDYGFDLPEQLNAQAVAELSYEIDTEIVELLNENAAESAELEFNTVPEIGVSLKDHYLAFLKVVEDGKAIVYKKTRKCVPNYMVCAADVKAMLACIPEAFKASGIEKMAGPYFAGTLNGMKVYVHPELVAGRFFLGVNSSDMATSAAVFAPYMPIIPTQLIEMADGSSSQGFSTLYDLRILNKDLLVAGKIFKATRVIETHPNN